MEYHPVTGQLSSPLPTKPRWRWGGKIGNANTEDARKSVLSFLFSKWIRQEMAVRFTE